MAKCEKICGDVEQNLVLVSLPLKLFCGRAEDQFLLPKLSDVLLFGDDSEVFKIMEHN